jgi:peptide alpha-N-acetyltransferase
MADVLTYRTYKGEGDLPQLSALIAPSLSEPYSVFTYRFFVNNWPNLCLLGFDPADPTGDAKAVIVGKIEPDAAKQMRGYIGMLAVHDSFRKKGVAKCLVKKLLTQMRLDGADVCVLETEVTNKAAIGLYTHLNFVKDKKLHAYYLNGIDAYRLKYWLKPPVGSIERTLQDMKELMVTDESKALPYAIFQRENASYPASEQARVWNGMSPKQQYPYNMQAVMELKAAAAATDQKVPEDGLEAKTNSTAAPTI